MLSLPSDAGSPIAAPMAATNPLDTLPMRPRQVAIVALVVILSALDGFDLMSMAFVAPALGKLWHLDPAATGLLLASGIAGMAAGALVLSPLADVVGRKPAVLAGLLLLLIGTSLSAFCTEVSSLLAARVVTGLGAGFMAALTTSLAAEFASARRRGLAVAATTIGFPIGGISGGLVAAHFLAGGNWSGVFLTGSALAALLFAVVALTLPESPAFIIDRRPRNAPDRLGAVLARLGQPAPLALPPQPRQKRRSYRALFAPGVAGTTTLLAIAYALLCAASYYFLSWLPQMIVDAGYVPATASRVAGLTGIVGIGGGLCFGALSSTGRAPWLAGGAMLGFGVMLGGLSLAPSGLAALMVCAAIASFCVSAANAAFYATLAGTFSSLSRASGIGLVTGVGRIASALGPYIAGQLLAHGVGRGMVSDVFGVIAMAAGLCVLARTYAGTMAVMPVADGRR